MNQRETQKLDTKNRIHDAIFELISEKDYDSITIREICARAQISIGSYYKHFESKEDIILQAMKTSADATQHEFEHYRHGESGYEQLASYLEFQMKLMKNNNISWLREIFRTYLYHLKDMALDETSVNFQSILSCVKQGQQDGSIRCDDSAEAISWIVLKMIIANFFSYCMLEGNFDLKKVMIHEILMIVKG